MENDLMEIYRSPYEAYPFLAAQYDDLRCDFDISTDQLSSLIGLLSSFTPDNEQ